MFETKKTNNNPFNRLNINTLRRKICKTLSIRYQSDNDEHNLKLINDIIFNERVLIVARFKDYLILDDNSEFLKRNESKDRLTRIFEFYEINSKIFPNYIILSESRYIYKNIQRKQKLIDQLQEMEMYENEKKRSPIDSNHQDRVLNTEECNSIMNQTQSVYNVKSTKNNSINNSFNSIEMLVSKIEKADSKLAFNSKKTIVFQRNDSHLIVKKKSEKVITNENLKGKHIQKPSLDNQLTKSLMAGNKDSINKQFSSTNEKNSSLNKTPDKLKVIENAYSEITNKEKNIIKSNHQKVANFTSFKDIYTNEQKSHTKSRNQPNIIEGSKSIPKTFDQKLNPLKTPEHQKTFQKKNSEISMPRFSLATTTNVFSNKFMSKNSMKSDSKTKPPSTKNLNDTKEVVPFKIMINLDSTDHKKSIKPELLSNRKFTRNLRNKLYIDQMNTAKASNYLQLSNVHNPFKSANKITNDKLTAKQTIEVSSLMLGNVQKDAVKNVKTRNLLKQQLIKQDSVKNSNTNSNINQVSNLFLSNNNSKINQHGVSRNFILHLTQSNNSEKKNHTPDFNKINKNFANYKSPLKNEEMNKILKKISEKNALNRASNEKVNKLNNIFESTLVQSIPNSARVDNVSEKRKNQI